MRDESVIEILGNLTFSTNPVIYLLTKPEGGGEKSHMAGKSIEHDPPYVKTIRIPYTRQSFVISFQRLKRLLFRNISQLESLHTG